MHPSHPTIFKNPFVWFCTSWFAYKTRTSPSLRCMLKTISFSQVSTLTNVGMQKKTTSFVLFNSFFFVVGCPSKVPRLWCNIRFVNFRIIKMGDDKVVDFWSIFKHILEIFLSQYVLSWVTMHVLIIGIEQRIWFVVSTSLRHCNLSALNANQILGSGGGQCVKKVRDIGENNHCFLWGYYFQCFFSHAIIM